MHSAKDSLMACRLNDFLSANRLETIRYQFCFEARVIGLVRLRARGSCRVRSSVLFSNPAPKLCIFPTGHIMVCSNIYLRFQQVTGSAFNFFAAKIIELAINIPILHYQQNRHVIDLPAAKSLHFVTNRLKLPWASVLHFYTFVLPQDNIRSCRPVRTAHERNGKAFFIIM